ncbi:MAG: hypothetical protein ACRC1R_03655 [Cetobacterium sp.]|uniref:hypothetical protein n=1 Tax=Cetobacterium sp. TaxID=2071632 RepID=UPI003F3908D5
MKKLAIVLMLAALMGCSSTISRQELVTKYNINKESVKNWDKTIPMVVEKESLIEDWYGGEDVLLYLRKSGSLNDKDVEFLKSLKTKNITPEDEERFEEILTKAVSKLPREFYLKDENLKDPKGLVDIMVRQSYLRMDNPSNHIAKEVATESEWQEIVALSKQKDLSESDTKKLRKLLNKFIKRQEFFDSKSWYNVEVSPRVIEIVNISKKENETKLERNNVNAKALYIAYPEYFSKLDKWDD